MRYFTYDEQTFKDLEIDQGPYSSLESIFTLFNQTNTKGGSAFLNKLMRNPVSDLEELQNRRDFISYLQGSERLEISGRLVHYIEVYLNLNNLLLKPNQLDLWLNAFQEWKKPSNEYYLIRMGCESIIKLVRFVKANSHFFFETLSLQKHFTALKEVCDLLIDRPETKKKLKRKELAQYDQLFRSEHKELLTAALTELYRLDAYQAAATASIKRDFCLPKYHKGKDRIFQLEQLFHPLLENAVPNNLHLTGKSNLCFLTGPNMVGKSTFLKAVGIAVYLAHLGFPVPAKSMQLSVFDGIFTTINLSDNLELGHSHFYSEVNRVKQAAVALTEGKRLLIIFDELFRGTNVKDAYDASVAIIKRFAVIQNSAFFISTHITEVADQLHGCESISYYQFNPELINGHTQYTYRIAEGISNQRLGLKIIEKEGILGLLDAISS